MQPRGGGAAAAKRPPVYSAMVHCGSIRQAAQVVAIQEVALPSPGASPRAAIDGPGAAALDPATIEPALAAARLLRAEGWVPSAAGGGGGGGLLASSQGSLGRLGSSWAGSSPEGSGDWGSLLAGQRSGSVPALLRTGSGGGGGRRLGRSPGGSARLGESLGGASSTGAWSDSDLSSCSYDSGGGGGGGWASEGGRGPRARHSGGGRHVGWAEAPAGPAAAREEAGEPEAGGGQQAGQQQLRRHPSLAAARRDPDLGCLARVRLQFVKRPEWLVQGARLVLRDRGSGRAAAVGYVLAVGLPETGPYAIE